MALDQETLRRKNEELSIAYKEKNRKLLQIQELYDKLKRKAMLGHIQDAASDAVDTTLHGGTATAAHSLDRREHQGNYEQQFGIPGATRYVDSLGPTTTMLHQPPLDPSHIRNDAWERAAPKCGTYKC